MCVTIYSSNWLSKGAQEAIIVHKNGFYPTFLILITRMVFIGLWSLVSQLAAHSGFMLFMTMLIDLSKKKERKSEMMMEQNECKSP